MIPSGSIESFLMAQAFGGGGRLKSFYGDGSDGAFNPSAILQGSAAPNGGNVSNLFDANPATAFTTDTLPSAATQVILTIDLTDYGYVSRIDLFGAATSVGTRTLTLWRSDDGETWTQQGVGQSTNTTPGVKSWTAINAAYRYWQIRLASGGSNCTLTVTGMSINTNDEAVPWRILLPSDLHVGLVVKQYTTITLPAGYEMTTVNPCRGLVIYCQGNATINGKIDMSRKAGLSTGDIPPLPILRVDGGGGKEFERYLQLMSDLMGLRGGAGGNGGGSAPQLGGTGGPGRVCAGGFGGGGGGGQHGASIPHPGGGGGPAVPRSAMNTAPLIPYNGSGAPGEAAGSSATATAGGGGACNGGGGGGGGSAFTLGANVTATAGTAGDYAGGYVCLISGGNVTIGSSGALQADGGAGGRGGDSAAASGTRSGGGGGGGAGGGVVVVLYRGTYSNSGSISVAGGAGGIGGAGAGTGNQPGGNGTPGAPGTIYTQKV